MVERGKVGALIEKATNSTAGEVDPRLLKAIKSVARFSDSELRLAAHTLMDLMKRDHSQVFYLSFSNELVNKWILLSVKVPILSSILVSLLNARSAIAFLGHPVFIVVMKFRILLTKIIYFLF